MDQCVLQNVSLDVENNEDTYKRKNTNFSTNLKNSNSLEIKSKIKIFSLLQQYILHI